MNDNKELDAWERIKKGIDTNIWECGYWDDIETIEKALKTLKIIKNKCSPLLKEYLFDLLPEEESELLKEVL